MQALCGLQGIFDLFNCKTPELDVENLPAPAVPLEDQDSAATGKKESVFKPEAVAGKIAA